jgi:Viral BACON domain
VGAFSLGTPTPILAVSPSTISFNATAGGSNPAPATINVTNAGTGTLTFTASSDSSWLSVSPASGTAPTAVQAAASISGLAAGTYTGHITLTASGAQGSPAVITVTLTVSSSSGGGTLAIDATVSKDNGSASSSVTSPAFATSSGNELLLAFVATDAFSANMTVTSVTGAGLTWTLVQRTNTRGGTSEIWRAFATTTLSNATVTANLSQSVVSSLTVMSFTGVDTSGTNGSGAIGATGTANAASGAPSASLTTTRNNSWVLGVGNDYDNAIARTVGANQTLVHQYLSPTGDTYWVQRQNAVTPTSGTVVKINDTAPTGDQYNLSIVEVLPQP